MSPFWVQLGLTFACTLLGVGLLDLGSAILRYWRRSR